MRYQESLLSPIRALPPEILGEIFGFITAPIELWFQKGPPATKLKGPFFLTWVCIAWRNQALSKPELWSFVSCNFRLLRDANSQVVNLMKESILRSRPRGFSLQIDMGLFGLRGLNPAASELNILNTLIDELGRLKSLDVRLIRPSLEVLDLARDRLKASSDTRSLFPVLESLTFRFHIQTPFFRVPINPFRDTFSYCPRLRTLNISHLRATDVIDTSHLTDLRISGRYMGTSFAILLRKCPLLQTFSVDYFNDGPGGDQGLPVPTIHHTHLTSLNIHSLCHHSARGFWKSVHLPNLTHLSVKLHMGYITSTLMAQPEAFDTLDELKEMLVRSQCALRNVSLTTTMSPHFPHNIHSFLQEIIMSEEADTCVTVDGSPYNISSTNS